MKNRLTLALGALVLTLASAQAFAQGTSLGWGQPNRRPQTGTVQVPQIKVGIVGGVYSADSSGVPFQMDVNGYTKMTEMNPLSSQVSGFIALIDDTTAVGMADSSTVQTLYANYIVHGLWVRVQAPAGAAVPFVRLAVQVRTHLNGTADSLSTAAVQLRRSGGTQATAGDTLSVGQAAAPTSVAAGPDEMIVTIARAGAAAAKWDTGPMQYVPLALSNGDGIRLPNFSVRTRNLSSGATGATARVTVYAYCTALR